MLPHPQSQNWPPVSLVVMICEIPSRRATCHDTSRSTQMQTTASCPPNCHETNTHTTRHTKVRMFRQWHCATTEHVTIRADTIRIMTAEISRGDLVPLSSPFRPFRQAQQHRLTSLDKQFWQCTHAFRIVRRRIYLVLSCPVHSP